MRSPLAALLFAVAFVRAAAQSPADLYARDVRPLLTSHCGACHNAAKKKAGFDVAAFAPEPPSAETLVRVKSLKTVLSAGEMPPLGAPRPPAEAIDALIRWADAYVLRAKDAAPPADPGRTTMRRLSKLEYQNTIRDLFGFTDDVTSAFPPDNLAYGFDSIGDAASFSLLHLEKYLAAAEAVAEKSIDVMDPKNPPVRRFEAEFMTETREGVSMSDMAFFYASGLVAQTVTLPRDGEYLLRARAAGDQAGPDIVRMGILDGEKRIADILVPEKRPALGVKEVRVALAGGVHTFTLSFLNDYYNPDDADPKNRDRNLMIDWFEIVGPVDVREPTVAERWIFAKDPKRGAPDWRAKPVVEAILSACFRRPATASEIAALTDLVKGVVLSGRSFAEGVRAALVYCLVSPHFLYRLEPGDATPSKTPRAVDLQDWALASRLSYFLWSSMPDERLFARARKGELASAAVLIEETKRMLADPKSDALAENFAAQWLELRNLDDLAPDPVRFAAFTPELKKDARREAELFFLDVLRSGRSVYDFVDSNDTFLNERLATFYGISGVNGDEFRKVEVADRRRGGLLGQASMLALTSNPTRTSPVKRGKWVLENILDAATPPPPPGVDGLKDAATITTAKSLRERLAEHRKNPDCAVCHNRLDALGFALENYDPIGRWRAEEGGTAIDAGGVLPDGTAIRGPEDLRRMLRADPRFLRCLAKKLLIYAVGRELGPADQAALDRIVEGLPKDRPTLLDLATAIVSTDAFRRRRA